MPQFNLRVYGLLIDAERGLLVSDELIRGSYITKFPGGGLEWGEGTRDCLKREIMEEMNLPVEIENHFYTTDFFQLSAFRPEDQIISIYYLVKPLQGVPVSLATTPFAFTDAQLEAYKTCGQIESFRFIPLHQLSADRLTLPIDKVVVDLLLQSLQQNAAPNQL